ncbi:MAG: hypothetical protein CK541_06660 [Opitutia bacterium]|nr:MAG: hypothetical protein CK541_06660 [Opitutae bacterium]
MERREFLHLTALGSLGAVALSGCAGGGGGGGYTGPMPVAPAPVAPTSGKVMLGIDVLAAEGFARLKGLRCGLVTHRAGVNGLGQRTVDVLARAPGVKLVKLFGPEHGIDGVAKADVSVAHAKDARTGLPIYSLYGATRRPTPEMLSGLDVIVIDFQDIGVRSYTYISCMRYVIEACFSLPRPVRVVVLDRPNPLGGEKVDGPFLDRKWRSYVGAYETPYVHGLTIGEIARWAVATPGVLELDEATRRRGTLDVVTLRGWRRSMTWNLTGLNWTATSPMINSSKAALGYAMSGLGCMDSGFSHSSTADQNFRFLTYPRRKAADLMAAFGNAVPGLTLQSQQQADGTQGVYLAVGDWPKLRPTAISLFMLRQACVWAPNPFAGLSTGKRELFIKHLGSEAFFDELRTQGARIDLARWLTRWDGDAAAFRARTAPFHLYA